MRKKPCKNCEKLNKSTRYHADSVCWFNRKENYKEKKTYIMHINNSVVEAEFNDTDKKKLIVTPLKPNCYKIIN